MFQKDQQLSQIDLYWGADLFIVGLSQAKDIDMSIILGPAHQLGIVVRDIEAAMVRWTKDMGVGPFFYLGNPPIFDYQYLGKSSPIKLRAAFACSGPMQIELIEQGWQPADSLP